jgi:hypothetical protein
MLERETAQTEPPVEEEDSPSRLLRWYGIFSSLLFIVFCFELGVFLFIFPWLQYWERNWFSSFVPEWHHYWANSFVRGAVSGLGVLNIYIALAEIFRLRRFSQQRRH